MRALLGVEEYGGFSAAASAMETVQSNISTHVSRLESELEVVLVERRTGSLTPEGTAVAKRARLILKEMEAIQSDLHALKHDIQGTVRMGMIGTTGRWLIPLLVPELTKRHPNLHFAVSEGTTTSLEARLHNGTVDLALVNKPPYSEEFAFKSLFDEEYVLFINASHPLAAKGSVTIAELNGIGLIVPPKGIPFRELLDTLAKRNRINFNIIAEVDGVRLIASMAFDGYAPAIIPATAVPHYLSDFAVIPVKDLPNRRIGIAKRKRALESAPMISVLDLIDEIFANDDSSRFPMPAGTYKVGEHKL
ncbi:MAG: LysR family transcriptional regulator [Acidimicrobiaceae bacterium]|nr:LysR family transcriptional regulator [Acidimicrobiaceae bacterium]